MKKIKAASLIMALLILSLSLACYSCENEKEDSPPAVEMNFLVSKGSLPDIYVSEEDENNNSLFKAISKRNKSVEMSENVIISCSQSDSPAADQKDALLSGSCEYDVICDSLSKMAPLALENVLTDLNQIQSLDLSKDCWQKSSVKDLSIKNRLYFAVNDSMLVPKNSLCCLVYNNALGEKLGIESPLKAVENNEWTIDKMAQLLTDVKSDLNNDEKFGYEDRFAFVAQPTVALSFLFSCSDRIVKKDDTDVPYITMTEQPLREHFSKVMSLLGDKNLFTSILDIKDAPANDNNIYSYFWKDAFTEERILFREAALHDVKGLKEAGADFCLIPMPKYESSEEYYHAAVASIGTVMAIPKCCSDPEKTGSVIQKLAEESADVNSQYIDFVASCESDKKMLELIIPSAVYDLGAAFDFGGLSGVPQYCAERRKDKFDEKINEKLAGAQQSLKEAIDSIS